MVVKEKTKVGIACLNCGHDIHIHELSCSISGCSCKVSNIPVLLPIPHTYQSKLIDSDAKRIMARAGRRGGKTVAIAIRHIKKFLKGERVLYATPTSEQLGKWWFEVTTALRPLTDLGVLKKNETEHYIELPGTEQRIKGKTAWNANTLRGDYAGELGLDEFQLMDEIGVWDEVGLPMLVDKNGNAVIIYTPPSLRSTGVSKARDPRAAAKMFKIAEKDPRWLALHFTSHDNPYISREGLNEIIQDMSKQSYRQEILAEDDELQLSWLVYRAFNEQTNKIDRFEIPKEWLVYVGHDFGSANPAALFVAQDPATGNFYEFAEYLPGSGRSTAQHVEEFKKITEGYNVIWRSGGSHQEDEIRQGYGAHNWPIMEPKINSVKAQLDKTIGMMERNKVFIFKHLTHRLEEMMNCLWEPDQDGRPTDKIKDEVKYHLSAGARYLYSNFTPETVGSGRPRSKRSGRF